MPTKVDFLLRMRGVFSGYSCELSFSGFMFAMVSRKVGGTRVHSWRQAVPKSIILRWPSWVRRRLAGCVKKGVPWYLCELFQIYAGTRQYSPAQRSKTFYSIISFLSKQITEILLPHSTPMQDRVLSWFERRWSHSQLQGASCFWQVPSIWERYAHCEPFLADACSFPSAPALLPFVRLAEQIQRNPLQALPRFQSLPK